MSDRTKAERVEEAFTKLWCSMAHLPDERRAYAERWFRAGTALALPDAGESEGDWWARQVNGAQDLATLKSIAAGWPYSRPAPPADDEVARAREAFAAAAREAEEMAEQADCISDREEADAWRAARKDRRAAYRALLAAERAAAKRAAAERAAAKKGGA